MFYKEFSKLLLINKREKSIKNLIRNLEVNLNGNKKNKNPFLQSFEIRKKIDLEMDLIINLN